MKRILLPGYSALVPDTVYSKNGQQQIGGHDVDTILLLERFRYPTREEVRNYIVRSVKNFLSEIEGNEKAYDDPIYDGVDSIELTKLKYNVANIPAYVFLGIIGESDEALRRIEEAIPGELPEDPDMSSPNLSVVYGLLLSKGVYDKRASGDRRRKDRYQKSTPPIPIVVRAPGRLNDSYWFRNALGNEELAQNGLGERWDLLINLDRDFRLPDIKRLKLLLSEGAPFSNIHRIDGPAQDDYQVEQVIEMLYDTRENKDSGKPIPIDARQLIDTTPRKINYIAGEILGSLPDICKTVLQESITAEERVINMVRPQ
ncbi:MAG: hypothetical protein HY831_05235 [Candidatus Aenigmarchaeota archaeon]|nr:hypothetical protein [Candidatus Aenigmarchaeota archaeon]